MSGTGDALEAAILQGIDTNPASTYREDRRAAASHSAPNTDDELGSDLSDHDDDRDLYRRDDEDDLPAASTSPRGGDAIKRVQNSRTANRGAEGATNTGPKGVLRDQQLRAAHESAARSAAVHVTNRRMESLALSSESYTQQVERERREAALRLQHELDHDEHTVSREAIADLQAKERRREARIAELKAFHASRNPAHPTTVSMGVGSSERWFGHLREVDERGYVAAIDNEVHDVPIVIHIYSKAVEQCNVLTAALAALARVYPRTKFLQVQAAAIGFGHNADDDDEEFDELNPKTLEVLPTLLVYRAGNLVANLVRVDLDPLWNHGTEQDIRTLLQHHGAVAASSQPALATCTSTPRHDSDDD